MRTVTIEEIFERARIDTDTKYSTHTTTEELYIILAKAYRELYNIMTTKDESLFVETVSLTPVDGVVDLPDDFFKVIDVYEKNGEFRHHLDRTLIRGQGQTKTTQRIAYPTYTIWKNTLKFTPKNFNRSLYLDYLPLPLDINFKATGSIGDGELVPTITFTARVAGSAGNEISVTLVGGGTAGSEVVSVTSTNINITIEDGVSTVAQVKAAIELEDDAYSLITVKSTIAGALSTGTVTLSGGIESIDCVCNEDDYLVAVLDESIGTREESDISKFTEMKNMAYANLLNYLAPRDNGSTVTVQDVETNGYLNYFPRNFLGRY